MIKLKNIIPIGVMMIGLGELDSAGLEKIKQLVTDALNNLKQELKSSIDQVEK